MNPLRLGNRFKEAGDLRVAFLGGFLGKGLVAGLGLGFPGEGLFQQAFQGFGERPIKDKEPWALQTGQ